MDVSSFTNHSRQNMSKNRRSVNQHTPPASKLQPSQVPRNKRNTHGEWLIDPKQIQVPQLIEHPWPSYVYTCQSYLILSLFWLFFPRKKPACLHIVPALWLTPSYWGASSAFRGRDLTRIWATRRTAAITTNNS